MGGEIALFLRLAKIVVPWSWKDTVSSVAVVRFPIWYYLLLLDNLLVYKLLLPEFNSLCKKRVDAYGKICWIFL